MNRFLPSLALCLLLSACSTGKDRLEAAGCEVREDLMTIRHEFVTMRTVTVPSTAGLDEALDAIPSARDVLALTFIGQTMSCDQVAKVATMTDLLTLSLTDCTFDPDCLEQLQALSNLEALTVRPADGVTVSNDDLRFIESLSKLRSVATPYAAIDDAFAGTLNKLPALTNVYVMHTGVSDAFVAELANAPRLGTLHVDHTSVTTSGFLPLAGSKTLKRIHAVHLPASPVFVTLTEQCPEFKAVVLDVDDTEAKMLSRGTPLTVLTPERADQVVEDRL